MEKRRIEEIRGSAAKAKECELEKELKLYNATTAVGCDGFHPKVPLDVTKETTGKVVDVVGEGGAEWKMAATSMHDDVLLDSEECHECLDEDGSRSSDLQEQRCVRPVILVSSDLFGTP